MKVLQINVTVNTGSTGKITEQIGNFLLNEGHESFIAYGRHSPRSNSVTIKTSSKLDQVFHKIYTLITDKHGLGSKWATRKLIKQIKQINPELILLHNLHGYYLNYKILFEFLQQTDIPIVWTLFDCWPFTGHCSYFDDINCTRYKTICYQCPKKSKYPKSILFDNSKENYTLKKSLFTSIKNIKFIAHSDWLVDKFKLSFLKEKAIYKIASGVDLSIFNPEGPKWCIPNKSEKIIILGVANLWDKRKGLDDFFKLADNLDEKYQIVLVGLNKKQILQLPENIYGIQRTENQEELASIYRSASVFVNPTYLDNFPTTNLEALGSGTPVITYQSGGSYEAIDENTGFIVDQGNINGLLNSIYELTNSNNTNKIRELCRERALTFYDSNKQIEAYLKLIFEQNA